MNQSPILLTAVICGSVLFSATSLAVGGGVSNAVSNSVGGKCPLKSNEPALVITIDDGDYPGVPGATGEDVTLIEYLFKPNKGKGLLRGEPVTFFPHKGVSDNVLKTIRQYSGRYEIGVHGNYNEEVKSNGKATDAIKDNIAFVQRLAAKGWGTANVRLYAYPSDREDFYNAGGIAEQYFAAARKTTCTFNQKSTNRYQLNSCSLGPPNNTASIKAAVDGAKKYGKIAFVHLHNAKGETITQLTDALDKIPKRILFSEALTCLYGTEPQESAVNCQDKSGGCTSQTSAVSADDSALAISDEVAESSVPTAPAPTSQKQVTFSGSGGRFSYQEEETCSNPDNFSEKYSIKVQGVGQLGVDASLKQLDINIRHDYMPGVVMYLYSPEGSRNDVFLRNGSTEKGATRHSGNITYRDSYDEYSTIDANTSAPYRAAAYKPDQSLDTFDNRGSHADGLWHLHVCDAGKPETDDDTAVSSSGSIGAIKLTFEKLQ